MKFAAKLLYQTAKCCQYVRKNKKNALFGVFYHLVVRIILFIKIAISFSSLTLCLVLPRDEEVPRMALRVLRPKSPHFED